MIQQVDVAILVWIQEHLRTEFLTPFWKAVTFLGDSGWFWILLGILLLAAKKTRKTGVTVLLALGIGALITNVLLKNMVARIRPYEYTAAVIALLPPQSDFSFPSGHTCASFAAAFVCWKSLQLAAKQEKNRRKELCCRIGGWSAILLAVLIAGSRLYLGVHYPTDVLGGMLIGSGSGWLAFWIVRNKTKERVKKL